MGNLAKYCKLGLCSAMLYENAFTNDLEHLIAVSESSGFDEYEALEVFLPDNPAIRKLEIEKMRAGGKSFHYNMPLPLQLDGPCNCGSDNQEYQKNALAFAKKQLDYAAEGDAKLVVVTGCVDQGAEKRAAVLARFEQFLCELSTYAKPFGFPLVLEPIERGVFKNLALGPTGECAAFIRRVRSLGCENVGLMLDSAHLPLMGETFDEAVSLSMETGLSHIHLGDAVTKNTASPFYGHTHPPIGVQEGVFDVDQIARQLQTLFKVGYLKLNPSAQRPTISLEVRAYPGVSPRTSARVAYEKMCSAFQIALSAWV